MSLSTTSSLHTLATTSSAAASKIISSTTTSSISTSSSSLSTFTITTSSPSSASTSISTSTTSTDSPSVTGVVNPGNGKYLYYGCYNETTALNETSGRRALYGGSMEAFDTMTVNTCLNFCNIDGFAFGGLEYERECWCSQHLSVFAMKLADRECNFACKGNSSEICGGTLKLSVYQKNTNATSSSPRSTNMPTKLFMVGLTIAGLVLEML